ncbi:MAG TPA: hypothetical protein VIJ62_04365, partial [Rhizomicrobium sp.]
MEMPCENHIDPATGKAGHRHVGATDQIVSVFCVGSIERMVGDDDACEIPGSYLKTGAAAYDLPTVDTSVFEGQRAGSVDAQNGDLLVSVKRLQIVADISPEF